jgi:hypothetical protein
LQEVASGLNLGGLRRYTPDFPHYGQVCNNVSSLVKLYIRPFLVIKVLETLDWLERQCQAPLIFEFQRAHSVGFAVGATLVNAQ